MTVIVSNVAKRFGERTVFSTLNITLRSGLWVLRGANGSGKSTLLKMLCDIEAVDSGAIQIDGYCLQDAPVLAKQRLAYVPDNCDGLPGLRGCEYLRFVASVRGGDCKARMLALIERFRATPFLDTGFEQMSLGTRKKFFLAAAFCQPFTLIAMDEPSNGLDAAALLELRELMTAAAQRCVVLFSSHDSSLSEALACGSLEIVAPDHVSVHDMQADTTPVLPDHFAFP